MVKTNESGEYTFDVPAGIYEVSAELLGFNPVKVSKVGVKENESTLMGTLTLSTQTFSNDRIPLQRDVVPIPLGPISEPASNRL